MRRSRPRTLQASLAPSLPNHKTNYLLHRHFVLGALPPSTCFPAERLITPGNAMSLPDMHGMLVADNGCSCLLNLKDQTPFVRFSQLVSIDTFYMVWRHLV